MKRILSVVLLLLTVSACGVSNIKSDSSVRLRSDEAILLLGFRPESRIHLVRGPVHDNTWRRPRLDVPEVNAFPEQGYVFVKVKATRPEERLGVSLIFPTTRTYFGPCRDSVSPTFEAKPGVVNYVGDLAYTMEDGTMRLQFAMDEQSAQQFVRENHPRLGLQLTTQPMTPMKADSHLCDPKSGTYTIYVSIPRY
ncbi:hypothetical protein [Peristeroidobacter soli]|jgi:hypothetical protein|uniref:hypothetical protein n=1 Tax=Peristeroidobacter soli TaxID=2497877 RepID=UPI00101C6D26|nr:hypothetical protein [Peristeroidobacter soli]